MVEALTLVLLAICAGVGFMMFRGGGKKKLPSGDKDEPSAALTEGNELDIRRVQRGGVLSLKGVGPELLDFDAKVLSRHLYRQGSWEWYELECDRGGDKVWIDIEDDDELELSVVLQNLSLRDLGVSKQELERMFNNGHGSVSFKGHTYELEETGTAQFCKDGNKAEAERFRFWEFENENDDDLSISVASYAEGEYEASLSTLVNEAQLTVYSVAE